MGGGDPAGSAGGAGGKAPRGINHREPATRFDAAYALAELGDPSGRSALAAGLSDTERAWDAVTALTRLGTTDDAEVLGRALLGKHTPPEAIVLAAGAILKIAPASPHRDAARRVLIAALTARKVHVRGIAVEQLGETGGAWAIAPLEKLGRSGKGAEFGESIAAALRAIAERAGPEGSA
jgi:HEAT repeat protein